MPSACVPYRGVRHDEVPPCVPFRPGPRARCGGRRPARGLRPGLGRGGRGVGRTEERLAVDRSGRDRPADSVRRVGRGRRVGRPGHAARDRLRVRHRHLRRPRARGHRLRGGRHRAVRARPRRRRAGLGGDGRRGGGRGHGDQGAAGPRPVPDGQRAGDHGRVPGRRHGHRARAGWPAGVRRGQRARGERHARGPRHGDPAVHGHGAGGAAPLRRGRVAGRHRGVRDEPRLLRRHGRRGGLAEPAARGGRPVRDGGRAGFVAQAALRGRAALGRQAAAALRGRAARGRRSTDGPDDDRADDGEHAPARDHRDRRRDAPDGGHGPDRPGRGRGALAHGADAAGRAGLPAGGAPRERGRVRGRADGLPM